MDAPVVVPPRIVGPFGKHQPTAQRNVPPTFSAKQQQQQQQNRWASQNKQNKQPGPPGGGVGVLNANTGKVEDIGNACDLIRALRLLQKILSPEDFEKYEKVLIPPKAEKAKRREEALLEMVKTQERLEKQEMGHVEQISKLEHNLEQQKLMLQEVRSRLGTVREDVAALRALVTDPSEPNGNEVQPPLPPPLHPPPVIEEIGAEIDIEPENLPLGEKKRGALEAKKSLVKRRRKKELPNHLPSS